jgi:hypothetical protein
MTGGMSAKCHFHLVALNGGDGCHKGKSRTCCFHCLRHQLSLARHVIDVMSWCDVIVHFWVWKGVRGDVGDLTSVALNTLMNEQTISTLDYPNINIFNQSGFYNI